MTVEFVFRMIILGVLVLTFIISGSYRKRARESGEFIKRQQEGWVILFLRMAFGFSLLGVLLLNIFCPKILTWAKFELNIYIQAVGVVLAISCVPLIWWVFRSIGNNISETVLTKQDHELVTIGPYRWIRHPLYSSTLLLFFSISVTFRDWILFGSFLAGLIAFRLLVIPAEEKQLLEAFGEDYECYQSRTGALLPWIK
jgi:protein-S-isoprenylcysteine O-methyltransferase Ste14